MTNADDVDDQMLSGDKDETDIFKKIECNMMIWREIREKIKTVQCTRFSNLLTQNNLDVPLKLII